MTNRLWTKAAICSLALGAISALASCNQDHSNDTATDVPPDQATFTCPSMPTCDASVTVDAAGPALVITDPQVLARVPLERVVDQLADLNFSTITATETMQRLFDTMNDGASKRFDDGVHCDDLDQPAFEFGNGDSFTCPRAEGALADSEGFFTEGDPDFFYPVAIVNRFDMTPLSAETCGQYRVVYAKESGLTDPDNRVFLIFEAAVMNPVPGCLEACRPLAEYWKSLEGHGSEVIAEKIDQLFFESSTLKGFHPVIHPLHLGQINTDKGNSYGRESGQIRISVNMQAPWAWREMHIGVVGVDGDKTVFIPTTVKNNPAAAFFDPTSDDWAAKRTRESLKSALPALAAGDVMKIQTRVPPDVNGVESVLQGEKANDYYAAAIASGDMSFVDSIDSAIAGDGYNESCPPDDPLDAQAVLARATAQSCAGCHAPGTLIGQDRKLGCGLTWPDSLGQVHVDESGQLSPALTEVFLPHRAQVMTTFLQACDQDAINGSFAGAGDELRTLDPNRPPGSSRTH